MGECEPVAVTTPQGIDLFEVYEAGGALLLVTSSPTDVGHLEPGDVMVRRPWATAAEPVEVRRG